MRKQNRFSYWVQTPHGTIHIDASKEMDAEEQQAVALETQKYIKTETVPINPYTFALERARITGQKREVYPSQFDGNCKIVFLVRDGWINCGIWNKGKDLQAGEREILLADIGIKFNVMPEHRDKDDWAGLVYRWRDE